MNIFKNEFLVKLITTLCIFLVLIGFVFSNNKVYAADEEIWGGILIQPIIELITAIGDGAVDLLQNALLTSGQVKVDSLIKIEGEIDPIAKTVVAILAIFAFMIVAVAVMAIGGFAGTIVAGLTKVALGTAFVVKLATVAAVAGVISGVCVAKKYSGEWFPKDLYLPTYKVTAQEIFSNELAIFDVNFFNPNPNSITQVTKTVEQVEQIYDGPLTNFEGDQYWEKYFLEALSWIDKRHINNETTEAAGQEQQFQSYVELENFDWPKYISNCQFIYTNHYSSNSGIIHVVDLINTYRKDTRYKIDLRNNNKFYAKMYVHVDEDYNSVVYYNIRVYSDHGNFMVKFRYCESKRESEINIYEVTSTGDILLDVEMESTASQLRGIISKWYFILRNLALLILMLILIYTGIRIVIGSTAGEKAKYKERLIDWIVALCLVMIMHYIMVFAIEVVEKITDLVRISTGQDAYVNMIQITKDKKDAIEEYSKDGIELNKLIEPPLDGEKPEGWDGIYYLAWPTDLMGHMRVEAQTVTEGTARWAAYSIAFVILVFFTIFFSWAYLKRVVYMAFLTVIAPIVAMTYPIDKMTDGKAQAFNMWLKEYIFNLLIQPMHLLLYTMLITSAFELASTNALYTLVAVGFMIPAEKFLRKLFGFEKAKTPGMLGGAAGAALTMTGIQSLIKHSPTGKDTSDGENKASRQEKNDIKFSSKQGVSAINNTVENINFKSETLIRENNINIGINQQQESTVSGASVPLNGVSIGKIYSVQDNKQEENPKLNSKGIQVSIDNNANKKQENGKDKKTKNKRVLRTMGAVIGSYGRGQKNKALKRLKNGHPIRSLVKGTTGLAGAATLGTLGLALGVASGDASKTLQYTTTTVAGGYKLGKGVAGSAIDILSVDGNVIKNDAELAWYGDDYKKAKLNEQKEDFIKDEGNIAYLRKSLGITRKDAKNILKEEGNDCLNSGISNIEDIATIHEMVKKQDYNIEDAIAIKKFSDRLPTDINKMSASKIEGHRKQFQSEIEDKLRSEVKVELVDKIRREHEEEIRTNIVSQLIENKENVETDEVKERINQLTNENIEHYTEEIISEQAKEKSEDIILGIIDFYKTKAALKEV